jgi:hypothetical protein
MNFSGFLLDWCNEKFRIYNFAEQRTEEMKSQLSIWLHPLMPIFPIQTPDNSATGLTNVGMTTVVAGVVQPTLSHGGDIHPNTGEAKLNH